MNIERIVDYLIASRSQYKEIVEFSLLPGIYAFFYNGKELPYFPDIIKEEEILYIGKTESSQKKRNAQTHFTSGKTGSSTVRKSFGALLRRKLSLSPIPRNTIDYEQGRLSHFKFDENSEIALTNWMQSNLSISFYEYPKTKSEIKAIETEIIHRVIPILNIDKNPSNPFKNTLKQLRKDCAIIAYSGYSRNLPVKERTISMTNFRAPGSQGIYCELWRSKISEILRILENPEPNDSIQLNSREFELVGNRKRYSFNLEFSDGVVSNNISGSAVARDLAAELTRSVPIKSILKEGHYKFNMDKDYCLWVRKLNWFVG